MAPILQRAKNIVKQNQVEYQLHFVDLLCQMVLLLVALLYNLSECNSLCLALCLAHILCFIQKQFYKIGPV